MWMIANCPVYKLINNGVSMIVAHPDRYIAADELNERSTNPIWIANGKRTQYEYSVL